ncbi:MAG: TenA family protein [Elainella sp. Prado103]|jgi:thiaminase/transcriptional activator TenA|nr:TenA family protein [Elainella sp. Prado103]
MSIAAKLWQINQDLAQACLDHPFVRGIGDGQLAKVNFAYYVGQDAFFLEAFARAYSVAAAKMPDWQGFQILHELAGGVLAELHLHQSYAQQWEVDLRTVIPGAATRRYTDFLLATAWSQSVGITIAAMLPCMRLYAFLGQSLAENGIPEHPYSDWIRTYSSDQFEPLAQQLADLADRYTPDGDEPMHSIVQATYRYAMQCELDFFEAAWQYKAHKI